MMNLLAIVMEDLWTALDIMWKGVLAIAIVIALVIVVTNLVNKACVSAEQKASKKAQDEENKNGTI